MTGPFATLLALALGSGAFSIAALASPALAGVRELPVPTMTIYPGDTVSAGMITNRRFRVTAGSVSGVAMQPEDLIGKQARRRLVAGKPVPLNSVVEARKVRRGATVSASFEEDGLSITVTLVALQDGSIGEVIRARNADTGTILRAMIKADGTLAVVE